jgi:hypothetical protein
MTDPIFGPERPKRRNLRGFCKHPFNAFSDLNFFGRADLRGFDRPGGPQRP